MYILISVFVTSLLGTIGMIVYKMVMLRTRGTVSMPAQSIEYHVEAFSRAFAVRWVEKVRLWVKNIFVPVVFHLMNSLGVFLVRLFKTAKDTISRHIDSRTTNGISKKGAVSFFLKDITEHKKSTNKKEV